MGAVQQQADLNVLSRVDQALLGLPADQLVWLSGYLYGLARNGGAAAGTAAQPTARTAVNVYFGSQTGNARRLAEHAAAQLEQSGFATTLVNLARLRVRDLGKVGLALFVVSTQGDGEPAEDARDFCTALAAPAAPKLPELRFAVLGLGDSSYPRFNEAGRWLEARLLELGARALRPRLEGDLDYERHAPQWLQFYAESLPKTPAPGTAGTVPSAAATSVSLPKRASPEQPAGAELLCNQRITARGAMRDVRHLEFAIDPLLHAYQPGDAFGVRFANPDELVEPLLQLYADTTGEIRALGQQHTLEQWLRHELEISRLSRPLIKALADTGQSRLAQELLEAPAHSLQAHLRELQPIDLLRSAPAALDPQRLLAALMPLKGRLYSIASSSKAVGDEIHLTVALRAEPRVDRVAYGACSTALAAARPGQVLHSWVEANERFRLPADGSRDIIMVGPGTGVAPFRGFLQERVALGASGRNWLVFGNRQLRSDFLYQLEWQEALREGRLHQLSLAFSRDGERRTYVQQRLLEQGAQLYDWLSGGAHLYVCGDAAAMAPAVEQALLQVFQQHAGDSAAAAQERLHALRSEGRYAQDVY